MKYKSIIFLMTCLLTNLQAQIADKQTDSNLLASISKDMKYFSTIAAITKQNEHYQPYIVSVFKSAELEKLGVANLKEALFLVPGIDIATDNFNNQTPIFRGSNPAAYGQSKLFIDGVLVNNLFFDSYSEYLSMPIDMIKRIEVIRGPGSKTDGINAYAGSINVITYAEDFNEMDSNNKLVFKYGSYNYRMGGFVKKFQNGNLKTHIDFYYQQDDKKISSGADGLAQGTLGANNAYLSQSGDAPLWLKDYSLGINVQYKDLSLKARMLHHTQGSAYGINYALPQNKDRIKLPSYYSELEYTKKIDAFRIDIKAGVKYDAFDSKAKLAPDNLKLGSVVFKDGIFGEHYAKQRVLYQSSYVEYSAINKHLITFGYRLMQEKTIAMSSKLSNRQTGDAALVDYTDTLPFFDKDAEREVYTVSLQDAFQFNDKISFLYGFNYQQTSLKDAGFEPRASMVYQADRKNIFKAIYSRAHRNPSWQEMFTENNLARVGSSKLGPEKVNSYEIAYIRNFTNDNYLQSNIFYLANTNQIYNSASDPEYKNLAKTDIYGLELEYKGHISSRDKIYLNYSYIDGTYNTPDKTSEIALPNVSNHLAKAYYIYNFNSSLSIGTTLKYVSSKNRVDGDSRKKVEAYSTMDSSLQYQNIKYDYNLNFSIKNIFNSDVRYPSPQNTYYEDYKQEGRTFLISLKKSF